MAKLAALALAAAAAVALSTPGYAGGTGHLHPRRPAGRRCHEAHRRHAGTVWEDVRAEIEELFAEDMPLRPRCLRLAWHSAGTYDAEGLRPPGAIGGSSGATMRFEPEASYGVNRGMADAVTALAPIHARHASEISVSDLWVFAAYVAIEGMEGPCIEFVPGRIDLDSGGDNCPPEERIPVPEQPADEIRAIFGRLGFDDRGIVALMGAHSVGQTHDEFSGFPGRNWDTTPQVLDTIYYTLLRDVEWQEDYTQNPFDPEGPLLRFFRSYSWIMLETDIMMRDDPAFNAILEEYADRDRGTELWLAEFGAAFKQVTELGLPMHLGGRGVPAAALLLPGGGAARGGAANGGGGADCDSRRSQLRGSGCPFAAHAARRAGKAAAALPAGHPPL